MPRIKSILKVDGIPLAQQPYNMGYAMGTKNASLRFFLTGMSFWSTCLYNFWWIDGKVPQNRIRLI